MIILSSEQFNELLNVMNKIANDSTSNIIAVVSVGIAAIALGASIMSNCQTNKKYIESRSPLVSFCLIEHNALLYLKVTNTGLSVAKDIFIVFESLLNNGDHNLDEKDKIFDNAITLYPNESVIGTVAVCQTIEDLKAAPILNVKVKFTKGNTNKIEVYCRSISFSRSIIDANNYINQLKDINKMLDKNNLYCNRIANCLDGRRLSDDDEL